MTITAKPILFSAPMIKALLREIEIPDELCEVAK